MFNVVMFLKPKARVGRRWRSDAVPAGVSFCVCVLTREECLVKTDPSSPIPSLAHTGDHGRGEDGWGTQSGRQQLFHNRDRERVSE